MSNHEGETMMCCILEINGYQSVTFATKDQPSFEVSNIRRSHGLIHVDVECIHYPNGKVIGAYGPSTYSIGERGNLNGTEIYLKPIQNGLKNHTPPKE